MSIGSSTSFYDNRNYNIVYFDEEGLRLVSINPKYKDIFITYDKDSRVVGVIVGNYMPLET